MYLDSLKSQTCLYSTEGISMSFIATRVAMVRESQTTNLTSEEELMTAPPDVQEQDPEVATAIVQDDTQEITEATQEAINDDEQIDSIATKIEQADDVSPEALVIAQERLNVIYSKYGLYTNTITRESASVSTKQQAQELVRVARENQQVIRSFAREGLKEVLTRVSLHFRQLFRSKSAYQKRANKIAEEARNVQGSPTSALYTNKVRIAHFTNHEQKPVTDVRELLQLFQTLTSSTKDMVNAATQMFTTIYEKRENFGTPIDFDRIFSKFKVVGQEDGDDLYGTTAETLYGQGIYFVDLPKGKHTNRSQLTDDLRNFDARFVKFWKVKDLNIEGLPVLPAQDVITNCSQIGSLVQELISTSEILDELEYLESEINDQSTNKERDGSVIDSDLGRRINLTPDMGVVMNFIRVVIHFVEESSKQKLAAVGCLLDYYQWSVKNHR